MSRSTCRPIIQQTSFMSGHTPSGLSVCLMVKLSMYPSRVSEQGFWRSMLLAFNLSSLGNLPSKPWLPL